MYLRRREAEYATSQRTFAIVFRSNENGILGALALQRPDPALRDARCK